MTGVGTDDDEDGIAMAVDDSFDEHDVPGLTPVSLAAHNTRARVYSESEASVNAYNDAIIADVDDGLHQSRSSANSVHAVTVASRATATQIASTSAAENNTWTPEESESLMMMMMDAHNDIVAGADVDVDAERHGGVSHHAAALLSVDDLAAPGSTSPQLQPRPPPLPPPPTVTPDGSRGGTGGDVDRNAGGWEEVPAEVLRQCKAEAEALRHAVAEAPTRGSTPTPASPSTTPAVVADTLAVHVAKTQCTEKIGHATPSRALDRGAEVLT